MRFRHNALDLSRRRLRAAKGVVLTIGFGLLCAFGARASDGLEPTTVVTPAKEVAWGEKALSDFLATRSLTRDGNLLVRVDKIGRELAKVSDRPNLTYRFLVVEGKELQAYSFPGGTVCLTEALAHLYTKDDEIAFALAHELAHIVLRHHVSQHRVQAMLSSGVAGEKAVLESVKARWDRDSEMEADRFGSLYAVRAGYRYTASFEALDRFSRAFAGPSVAKSHPGFADRISALKAFRGELEKCLEAFDRGVAALRNGDAEEAITNLKFFVSQFPNSVAGQVNLGAAHLAVVRSQAGTPLGLAEILSVLPEPGVVIRGAMDRLALEEARAAFQQALGTRRDDATALAGLALIHLRFGQLDEARELLTEALSHEPDNPELFLLLGNAHYLAGDYNPALAFYLRALALRKHWPEVRKNLAMTYEKLDKLDNARSLWSGLIDHPILGAEARRRLAQLNKEGN